MQQTQEKLRFTQAEALIVERTWQSIKSGMRAEVRNDRLLERNLHSIIKTGDHYCERSAVAGCRTAAAGNAAALKAGTDMACVIYRDLLPALQQVDHVDLPPRPAPHVALVPPRTSAGIPSSPAQAGVTDSFPCCLMQRGRSHGLVWTDRGRGSFGPCGVYVRACMHTQAGVYACICVCTCVCVGRGCSFECVRKRERDRETESVCMCVGLCHVFV